jgi:hypothetical protein
MPGKLRQLRLIALVPAVLAMWLFGSTAFIFGLSALNAPGINEHGTGLLLAMAIWFGAAIAALVHIGIILKARRRIGSGGLASTPPSDTPPA